MVIFNMRKLQDRLSLLKLLINTNYGNDGFDVSKVYKESYDIRRKIHSIKMRKDKIKQIFDV
jgi:hypothetical protein